MRNQNLLISMISLEQSVFIFNICRQKGIILLGQLAQVKEEEIKEWIFVPDPDPNFDDEANQPVPISEASVAEIKEILAQKDLSLGMELSEAEQKAIEAALERER